MPLADEQFFFLNLDQQNLPRLFYDVLFQLKIN